MSRSRPATGKFTFLLISVIILCLSLWLRTVDLYNLPVFVDEGNHILWAQRFSSGSTYYPWLMDGRFLTIVILSLFHPLGPSPLWLCRAVVAVLSVISCGACISIGAIASSRKTGLLAGLGYAILPFAVFHDRQVLADPPSAAFGAAAMVFALLLTRKQWRLPILLGIALSISFLAKVLGIVYLAFPVAAAMILPRSWKERWQAVGRCIVAIAVTALLVFVFVTAFYTRLGYNDNRLINQQAGLIGCPPLLCSGDLVGQIGSWKRGSMALLEMIPPYFGWPMFVLAILAFPISSRDTRRMIGSLWFSTGAILIATLSSVGAKADSVLPPRNLMMLAVPVVSLAAHSLVMLTTEISERIASGHSSARRGTMIALNVSLAALVVWPMTNTAPMVWNPRNGHYPAFDIWQYFDGRYSGYQFIDAVQQIYAREANKNSPPVIIVYGEQVFMVASYFDRTRVDVRAGGEVFPPEIGRWLSNGQSIYLVDEVNPATPSAPCVTDEGAICHEIARYPRHSYWNQEWTVRLRLVTEANEDLRKKLYPEFFIGPEKLVEEYGALINSLPKAEPVRLLLYPPNQADVLAPLLPGYPGITLYPIGDSWPLDEAAVENELTDITRNASLVKMAFVEETKGDPNRRIEAWLSTHLFRLEEQWFGPVRVLGFAGDGQVTQTIPVEARFGDSIALESIEILDSVSPPGGIVRIRLNLRADSSISQSLKVFIHIFAGESVIAQHDGQPVGELRPTNTWQAGERVSDQFAIRLPSGTQPGAYQLRIGLYDANTQARLSMNLPDGTTGDFFVGGQIIVK